MAEYDTLVQPTHYKKVPLKPFRYVVVNCDLGPVKVNIEADKKSFIEFHQTFMKYVEMNFRGDTLVIHTLKTPKSTKENPVFRQIYIHTPSLAYYKGEATRTTLVNFSADYLKIDNRSSFIRLYGCEIKDVAISTNKSCNFYIDENCAFDKIEAAINPTSAFTCLGYVETELFLKADNLQNIRFNENIRNLRMSKYHQ
jgi:hypothetical protein